MSNTSERKETRKKIDNLFGLDTNNSENNKTSLNNTTSSNSTAKSSKKKDIKLSDLNSNTISNISNLSEKQLSKNDTNTTLVNDIKQITQEKTQQLKENIQEKTQNLKKESKKTINKLLGKKVDENNNKIDKTRKSKEESNIFSIIIKTLIILLVVYGVYYYINNVYIEKARGIYLIDNTKDAKSSLVISQNSEKVSSNLITKSFNKPGGMEFTYSFWVLINNMDIINKGKWKHVFHKGERNIIINNEPNQNGIMSPGVFIHPNTNTIRIYMNIPTIDPPNLLEYVDISNIPLKKWVNITFTFTEQKDTINPNNHDKLYNCLDVYINGLLKTWKPFTVLPTLNESDLWISNFGGFDGFISKLKYYDSAIGVKEIQSLLKDCPSDKSCGLNADCPPYLSNKWWFS